MRVWASLSWLYSRQGRPGASLGSWWAEGPGDSPGFGKRLLLGSCQSTHGPCLGLAWAEVALGLLNPPQTTKWGTVPQGLDYSSPSNFLPSWNPATMAGASSLEDGALGFSELRNLGDKTVKSTTDLECACGIISPLGQASLPNSHQGAGLLDYGVKMSDPSVHMVGVKRTSHRFVP